MADMNILANDVPADQAPTIAPPIRTDDQILPLRIWVPDSKSNYVLDVLRLQRNPIFKVVVAILKNINFFRAFTTSSMIPEIYIQRFWDTMRYDSTIRIYNYQLDEQWFNLHKDILRDALQITPINDNDPFVAPPLSDAVIKYVNTLGYPRTLRNMSAMTVNDLYQPWRAIVFMINICLTGKTAAHDKPRHLVLQILWGKKKTTPLLIPSIRFTKLIIYHLKTKHNIHPRIGLPLHYSHEDNVLGNLKFVGKDGREVFDEEAIAESPKATNVTKPKAAMQTKLSTPKATKYSKPAVDKTPKPTYSQPPKPNPSSTKPLKEVPEKKRKLVKVTLDEPSPAKRSKGGLVGKRRKPKSSLKLVGEFADEGVPITEPRIIDEEADFQRGIKLSLKDLDVRGKGKEKLIGEPVAHTFLDLNTLKKKSAANHYILQKRTLETAEPTGPSSKPEDEGITMTNSELESGEIETGSYKTYEDKNLYEALEKSMDRDHSDQLQADLAKAHKKRQKRSDSPRTLFGSPPPPPPPPPSLGASGAPGASRASGSSQLPPPPPSSSSKPVDSDKSKHQMNVS
nr:hypothetical protein [Tanacetum cinerariifolium]